MREPAPVTIATSPVKSNARGGVIVNLFVFNGVVLIQEYFYC